MFRWLLEPKLHGLWLLKQSCFSNNSTTHVMGNWEAVPFGFAFEKFINILKHYGATHRSKRIRKKMLNLNVMLPCNEILHIDYACDNYWVMVERDFQCRKVFSQVCLITLHQHLVHKVTCNFEMDSQGSNCVWPTVLKVGSVATPAWIHKLCFVLNERHGQRMLN